jgi:hypothetical protein
VYSLYSADEHLLIITRLRRSALYGRLLSHPLLRLELVPRSGRPMRVIEQRARAQSPQLAGQLSEGASFLG